MNQTPTPIRMYAPQRFIVGEFNFSFSTTSSCARPMANERLNMRMTMTIDTTTNAKIDAPNPPVVNANPARPTRIGPVHPKPATK
jgi:hypothetical protein